MFFKYKVLNFLLILPVTLAGFSHGLIFNSSIAEAVDTDYAVGLKTAVTVLKQTGKYPVRNIQFQTYFSRGETNETYNPFGESGAKCSAVITWDPPANPPNPLPYNQYQLYYGYRDDDSHIINLNLNQRKYQLTKNNTNSFETRCGEKIKLTIETADHGWSFMHFGGDNFGEVTFEMTLAVPAAIRPTEYNVSIKKIEATKSGNSCFATVSWDRASAHLDDPTVGYSLDVGDYHSGILGHTASSQKTSALECGKSYTAIVAIYGDKQPNGSAQRIRLASKEFTMPGTGQADGTSDVTSTGNTGGTGGDTTLSDINTDNTTIEEGSGEEGDCVKLMCGSGPGWKIWKVDQAVQHQICQMQCSVISWMVGMNSYIVEHVLIPSLGLDAGSITKDDPTSSELKGSEPYDFN